jgi:DNA gyrase subunit A
MLEQRDPRIIPVKVQDELKTAYLSYAMSSITARALPDVRDGLKPSQRRILVAMHDLNLAPGRGFRKCAKIAGDTSGNYHPHGEAIVYPTLVHMAQPFRLRYPLVDGQGNFGSIDGYPPAAMRYTEARMSHAAVEMLAEIDRNTVDLVENYDETRTEPEVLPARFPNLLCNGSVGISVAYATKLPPHNVTEICDALTALIVDADIDIDALMEYVKAPDFPTGGVIYGMSGVHRAYRTGSGIIRLRARTHVEEQRDGREQIIVTEIPYLVDKSTLLEKMAALVRGKTIEDISNIRDESGRDGLRIVIELKRSAHHEVVLNQLFTHSMLQFSFGVNAIAIVEGRPETLNLKQLLEHYVAHRHEVVLRRTRFDLGKAEARAHVLEGLRIALDNIDAIIQLIRASANPEEARGRLMEEFVLSEIQANAILAMALQRLTGLEREKIEEEFQELMQLIEHLKAVLDSRDMQMQILKDEVADIREKFGDERRTEIVYSTEEFDMEDLIARQDMVVTISRTGYIKRMLPSVYRTQARGGRGVTGMRTKDEDFVERLFIANTHSYILFLTARGQCHWLKVYRIPEADRTARGRPLVNLVKLEDGDEIRAVVAVDEFTDDRYLFTATRRGIVKKTVLSAYGNVRRNGIIALKIVEGDDLIGAGLVEPAQDILLATKNGQAVRFSEQNVRSMGRVSTGVKGVNLRDGDETVEMVVLTGEGSLLTVCENGFGKRTEVDQYPKRSRGTMGVIDIKVSDRNGPVVSCKLVQDDEEVMMVTQNGIMIRTPVAGINCIGRNTQGVRLINVDTGDRVIDMTRVVKEEEAVEGVEDGTAADGVTTDGADNGQMPAQAMEAAAEEEVAEEEVESEQESDDPLQDEDLDN